MLGNFIGTNAAGTSPLAIRMKVCLAGGSSNNTIGGATAGAGNVIAANSVGVWVRGSGSNSNTIQGNFIGTNSAGTVGLGNTADGVVLDTGVTGNLVGGSAAGAGNVISGNHANGIWIRGTGTTNNLVLGNLIGTTPNGTAALANTGDGVLVTNSATGNTIGGSTAAARNIISGNSSDGVQINGSGTTGNIVQATTSAPTRPGPQRSPTPRTVCIFSPGPRIILIGTNGDGVGDAAEPQHHQRQHRQRCSGRGSERTTTALPAITSAQTPRARGRS